jgi:polar amino acid transport system substrate-binding protein
MKRFLSVFLVLAIAGSLVLTSCSKTSTTTDTSTTTINVATDATWAPFETVNEQTKQIEGFDIDLFNAIAAKENIKINFINVPFDSLLAGIAQGAYDAAISSITITADRQKAMLFSDPYFDAGQVVTVQSNNTTIKSKSDLTGKTIAVQLGTTGNIEANNIAGATVKPYNDIGLAFQDLLNGQVDAVICDNPVALNYVATNPGKLMTAGAVFTNETYGIAIANGKTDLQSKINDGLAKIKADGTITTLAKKWKLAS